MRSPKDMPEQMPVTAAGFKSDDERTPDPFEVEKARLKNIITQTLYVYQQMEDEGAADAVALTELILNRFDDGVRP